MSNRVFKKAGERKLGKSATRWIIYLASLSIEEVLNELYSLNFVSNPVAYIYAINTYTLGDRLKRKSIEEQKEIYREYFPPYVIDILASPSSTSLFFKVSGKKFFSKYFEHAPFEFLKEVLRNRERVEKSEASFFSGYKGTYQMANKEYCRRLADLPDDRRKQEIAWLAKNVFLPAKSK